MGWGEGVLADLAVFQRGFDITREQQRNGPYPVVSSSGVTSYHDSYKVDGPGVVIGRKGSLGTVHYVEGPFWPHDTSLWVKDFRGNEPRFVYYYVKTMRFERFNVGGANPTLNRNHIHALPIRFPDLDAQRSIVGVLAPYDDLIRSNERRMALLEQSVHLLYREWFERLRFPGHEWARIVDGIPESWRRGTIADIAQLDRDAVIPDRSPDEEFDHYSFPAFDAGQLPAVERGDAIKSMKYRVTAGTVLVPKLNPHIPRVWVPAPAEARRAIASSEYLVLRPKFPATQSYLTALCGRRTFLAMLAGRADGTSTSHRRVKPSDFMTQRCLVPSEDVFARFDQRAAPILALQHTLKLQSRKAREARDYLLPRLMSGQLTV